MKYKLAPGLLLAHTVSVVFHPLLLTSYLFAFLLLGNFGFGLNSQSVGQMLKVVVLITFVLPMIAIFGLLQLRKITSLQLFNRNERYLPYLLASVFYLTLAYRFAMLNQSNPAFPFDLVKVLFGITASIMSLFVLNFFYKISAHTTGIGGALAIVGWLYFNFGEYHLFFPIIITLLLCGIVGAARLRLNAHTPAQVYLGYLVGALSCALTLIFL